MPARSPQNPFTVDWNNPNSQVNGFWSDRVGVACYTSFRSSQKVYNESDLLFLVHY